MCSVRVSRIRLLAGILAVAFSAASAWAQAPGEAAAAVQEEATTDITFALDVSGSMRTKEPDGTTRFAKVRDRLIEFIRNEVDLGAQITVVTFGERVETVASTRIAAEADKRSLIAKLQKMTSEARATYMAAGIETSLQTLQALAKKHPARSRILVLLTDGKNEPPKGLDPARKVTFDKLIRRYNALADFKPGEDWFFWYCFIGKPAEEVRKFVEAMGGESKPVTGPWRFLKVRFNHAVVNLGTVSTGDWTVEFPSSADRKLGESLRAAARAAGDYDLVFADVILEGAAADERIVVSPRHLRMDRQEKPVVLKLAARNIAPGQRRGRIVIRSPGRMVFVRPQQFHVRFTATAPAVAVAPRDGVPFGRLAPGASVTRTIELIPNEIARRGPGQPVKIGLPKDLPEGVTLSAEPATLKLTKSMSVRLTLRALPGARLPAGGYSGAVALTGAPGVAFTPAKLPVSFETGQAKIDVTPSAAVDFGTVAPGGQAVRTIYLTPNEVAAAGKPTVSVAAGPGLPEGVRLRVAPGKTVVADKTTVRLTLVLSPEAKSTGTIQGQVGLKVTDGAAALSQEILPWRAAVAGAVVDVTPGDRLDFGLVQVGGRQTRSLWLSPNAAAAAARPGVTFSSAGAREGTALVFEPQKVTLDRKREIKVTLVAGSGVGKQALAMKLACSSGNVRLNVNALAVEYRAESRGAWVDAQRLDFRKLLGSDRDASSRVRVVASQDKIGQTLRLAWEFGKTPGSMSIVPLRERVTISKAAEEVPLLLRVDSPVAGEYRGRLTVTAPSQAPQTIPVVLVVAVRRVEVVVPPGPWSIQLSAFAPWAEVQLPVVIKANTEAAGLKVSVQGLDELPDGVRIVSDPAHVRIKAGENTLTLKASVSFPPSLWGRLHEGKLTFVADSPHAVVVPDTLAWRVEAPPVGPYGAVAVGVAAVLLLVALWLWWPRRLVGALRIEDIGAGQVLVDELECEINETIDLEAVSTRSLAMGPGQECDIVLASPGDQDRPDAGWIVKMKRRRATYVVRSSAGGQQVSVEKGVGDVPAETLGPSERAVMEHGDKITIGQFVFVFENI